MTKDPRVDGIRAFNRTVTERLGALEDHYLSRDRSLGMDRVLWEIGRAGAEVRSLRNRLRLDSGYLSRLLRALEREGLVTVSPSPGDSRVRRATLTPKGLDELGTLDGLSDELVEEILSPLTEHQRDELARAASTVTRLFTASAVTIAPADPASEPARRAVAAYYRTLDARVDGGFRPGATRHVPDMAMRPPSGQFLLATLKGATVGCVGLVVHDDGYAEIKRLWVSDEVRGLGLGRRLLAAAEDAAAGLGATTARLDTNRALTEAIHLYRTAGYVEVAAFNDERYAHHWFEKPLRRPAAPPASIGFVGLGIMGRPMAMRLARSGLPLVVWNRSAPAVDELVAAGARRASTPADVFAECETVLVMLRNEEAADHVLRGAPGGLAALVRGRTVVNMGTMSPSYSAALAAEVETAGGAYVEAPVSGSRRPAEDGTLVAMVAGRPEVVRRVVPLLDRMCAQVTVCGPVPAGLTMKLAANVFLIALVTGLAEAFHFGQQHGLDLHQLRDILDAGQMSSPISRVKTAKLVDADLTPQAAVSDVAMNTELIVAAAAEAGIAAPVSELSRQLYRRAVERGDGSLDVIGIIRTIAAADDHGAAGSIEGAAPPSPSV